jgi:hypothetical protein
MVAVQKLKSEDARTPTKRGSGERDKKHGKHSGWPNIYSRSALLQKRFQRLRTRIRKKET